MVCGAESSQKSLVSWRGARTGGAITPVLTSHIQFTSVATYIHLQTTVEPPIKDTIERKPLYIMKDTLLKSQMLTFVLYQTKERTTSL